AAIRARLEQGELVLLSPLGYSPTGEIFNLTLENVAAEAAIALKAEKLIFLMDGPGIETTKDEADASLIRELTVAQGKAISAGYENEFVEQGGDVQAYLPFAVHACESGVPRAHLISRHADGALLQELFTRSGIGTMISEGSLQAFRNAK